MNFREGTEKDFAEITELHAQQNLGYLLPPLADRSIVVKLIAEKRGSIRFAALLRVTSEAYLIGSPDGSPRKRWQALLEGNDHLMRAAWKAGLSDINCFIPPKLEVFGKRLVQLGWEKNSWPSYSIWPGNVIAT
jgi:hypothetical protein